MAEDKRWKRETEEKNEAPEMDISSAPAPVRKPIQWFKNYWYYYKMHVVLIVPMLLVIVVFIVSALTKTSYDYTAVVSAGFTMESEQLDALCANLEQYLPDADGNGKLFISASELTLREELSDEYYAQSYNKLAQMMVFDEVVFFIADEYSYTYLKNQGFIEAFSVLGVGESDEYALELDGSPLLDGTGLERYSGWYLLIKTQSQVSASDEEYLGRREGLAAMIRTLKAQ